MYNVTVIRNLINQGTNRSTMSDWFNATKDLKLTAYDPCVLTGIDLIESDRAVNISDADRKRMNRSMPGVVAPQEDL
jgi:hypothetical protein